MSRIYLHKSRWNRGCSNRRNRKSASLGNLADALYPKLLDSKWLNATTSSAKYQEGVQIAINKAADDISAVKAMGSPFTETLLQVYVETLSLDSVTEKNNELTKAASAAGLTTAEEAAACSGNVFTASPASEQIPADTSEGVTIKIYGSRNQLDQITDFMKAIGVRYELL